MGAQAETIKTGALRREFEVIDLQKRVADGRTILTLSASSEFEVQRWWGKEVLSHEKGAVRMERIKRGAVPLLFNHDVDEPRGMVEKGWIEDKRLMVEAALFDTESSRELARMIDGGLRNVSLAYRIHVIEEDKDEERFTATDWEPLEISIVTVPADPTVGVGRNEGPYEVRMVRSSIPAQNANKGVSMKTGTEEPTAPAAAPANGSEPVIEVRSEGKRTDPVELEKSRRRAIENLCKANKLDDRYRDMWIGQGVSIEEVSDDILRILEERGKTNPQPASKIGLTPAETQRFSLLRAVRAVADNNWTNAPFELEASRAVAKKINRIQDDRRFFIPFEVMERPIEHKRDLNVATTTAGGFLVDTQNQGFIEILRNRSVAFNMGARRLSGLQGNVTIPRQSGAATAYWLASETTEITESQQTFAQVSLTPKTVGAYTEISRLLLLQSSPAAEGIVSDDLAQVVALAVDSAAIAGTGTEQPTGILETNGVPEVTISTLDYNAVLQFQVELANNNVRPQAGGYVTTPALAGLLLQEARFANSDTPLWVGNIWDGQMAGFRAMSSNQIASESVLFGDWQELVIGEWGVLEVEVNPYANFKAGVIGIRAMYTVDVALRRVFAFAFGTSVSS